MKTTEEIRDIGKVKGEVPSAPSNSKLHIAVTLLMKGSGSFSFIVGFAGFSL